MQQVQTPGWEGSSPDSARMNLCGTLEAPSPLCTSSFAPADDGGETDHPACSPNQDLQGSWLRTQGCVPPPPSNSPNSHPEILTQGMASGGGALGREGHHGSGHLISALRKDTRERKPVLSLSLFCWLRTQWKDDYSAPGRGPSLKP